MAIPAREATDMTSAATVSFAQNTPAGRGNDRLVETGVHGADHGRRELAREFEKIGRGENVDVHRGPAPLSAENVEEMPDQSGLADATFGEQRDVASVFDGRLQLFRLCLPVAKGVRPLVAVDDEWIFAFHGGKSSRPGLPTQVIFSCFVKHKM